MIEDLYFLDEGQINITAASIGISKQRWVFVNDYEIEEGKQIELMTSNRFDHLPIISSTGTITEYFKTLKPNDFSNIKRFKIYYDDVIPIETNVKDVIDKFASSDRTFYFLTFHKSISGLITVGNLNCKQVQVYIFSLICEVERELGDFLNFHLTENEIEDWILSKIDNSELENKYALMLENYRKLIENDLENKFTEILYLVDFFKIILDKCLYEKLSYTKAEWNEKNSINELRKRIAHPTRSLLDKENNIQKLMERINKINDLTFRLTTLKKNSLV